MFWSAHTEERAAFFEGVDYTARAYTPHWPPGAKRALPGYYMAIWLTGTKGLEASRYQWLGAGHWGDWLRTKAKLLWLIA